MVCKMIVRDASAIIIFHAQQGLCFPIPDLFKASHSLALLLALQSLHAVLREVKIIIVLIRAAGEVVSQVILPSAVDKLCMFMLVDEERTGPLEVVAAIMEVVQVSGEYQAIRVGVVADEVPLMSGHQPLSLPG